jgi:hypothetical protein
VEHLSRVDGLACGVAMHLSLGLTIVSEWVCCLGDGWLLEWHLQLVWSNVMEIVVGDN